MTTRSAGAGAGPFEGLLGEWQGTYRLWLEPGVLRVEGQSRCSGRNVLSERFAVLDYDWVDLDGPQSGSMVFAQPSDDLWQLAWIDTWHTADAILLCTGSDLMDVTCTYGSPGEEWGWRTTFDLSSPGTLVVTGWNVTPAGESAKATEATYSRNQ